MSSPLRAVASVRPPYGRVLCLGRSCFPVTRPPLSFTRSYSHVPSSWSSEHTYILGLRHLSSGRVRNEQFPPQGQVGADDSDTANAVCSHSHAEAASQTAESSAATPGSASSVSEGKTSPSLSGLSVDSNPAQSPPAAHFAPLSSSAAPDVDAASSPAENISTGETTLDAVSGVNVAENKARNAAQHKPSEPCLACGSPNHPIHQCPDRAHIKPNAHCDRCGSLDHWSVDCTARSQVRKAYRRGCPVCKEKGHLGRDCPNRAQHKPRHSCPACGSPDHWIYDCDTSHVKLNHPCHLCGSPDHWALDCTAPEEVQDAHRKKCVVCGQRGHTAGDCTDRAEHKPPKPCPACGNPDHWRYDCPEKDKIPSSNVRIVEAGMLQASVGECCPSASGEPVDVATVGDSKQTVDKGPQTPSRSSIRQAGRPSAAGNSKKGIRCFHCKGPHHFRDCPRNVVVCLACHGNHRTHDCPDKTNIKPRSPCYHCGGDDHWSVDCTASIEVQKAYRKKCFICRQRGHTAHDCTHRVEHKPSKPCPACGDPGHWVYDCPEKDKKPNFILKECAFCGGSHDTYLCWRVQPRRVRRTSANHRN